MKILYITIIAVLAVSVLTPAFADTVTVDIPEGLNAPSCDDTRECFIPYLVTIDVGDTVTWQNSDTRLHFVTAGDLNDPYTVGVDYPNGFDSGIVMAGNTFSHKFTESGTYPYFCMVHPWKTGIVLVANTGQNQNIPTSINPITDVTTKIQETVAQWILDFRAMTDTQKETKYVETKNKLDQKNKKIDRLESKIEELQEKLDRKATKPDNKGADDLIAPQNEQPTAESWIKTDKKIYTLGDTVFVTAKLILPDPPISIIDGSDMWIVYMSEGNCYKYVSQDSLNHLKENQLIYDNVTLGKWHHVNNPNSECFFSEDSNGVLSWNFTIDRHYSVGEHQVVFNGLDMLYEGIGDTSEVTHTPGLSTLVQIIPPIS